MSHRVDASDKLSGAAKYIADQLPQNCWHAAVVRSPVAKGKLLELEFDKSFNWKKVVVVTAKDIPGKNVVPFVKDDMPLFAEEDLNFLGEAIAAVAAPTAQLAKDAAAAIRVKCKKEKPAIGFRDARKKNESITKICAGAQDIDAAMQGAHKIIEGTYETGFHEQAYIEPQGILAVPDGDRIDIIGSLQCPFYILKDLMAVFGWPEEKFSVKQATVGGAFGGKEDYPSHLACYAALLANKAKKPVAMIYDRREDICFTTKRHPSVVKHRTAVDKEGNLLAMDISVELDAGAYATLSPVVLARSVLHAQGTYRCPHVRISGVAWKTNIPPTGAFRGFGAPQSIFAIESHMDEVAKALKISPLELRQRNAIKIGDKTATGQILKESVSATEVLQKVCEMSDFAARLDECKKADPNARVKKGVGLAMSWHGGGFTGSGEDRIKAKARIRIASPQSVNIEVSSVEMGQGAHTALAQIVARALGLGLESVKVITPDTSTCPDSGPTVASRTTMVVGKVLEDCAKKLRQRMDEFGSGAQALESFFTKHGEICEEGTYSLPQDIHFDDDTFSGDAYPAYAWGATVAEVEVDRISGDIKLCNLWIAIDCGKTIDRAMAAAQVEGGSAQAIGYALMEQGEYAQGKWNADGFQKYAIPTALDIPDMKIEFIENLFSYGPEGAKGLGELPMSGPAPAIANAIASATGKRLTRIPITPEHIYEKDDKDK